MTNEQKTVVESLRSQGLGYKRIAAQTGISAKSSGYFVTPENFSGTMVAS